MKLGVKQLGNPNYLVYDEMSIETEFDFEISEEQVLANFAYMKVSPAGDYREAPIFSELDISPAEYEDFWDFAQLRAERWLDFFNNEIFQAGVPLPYWKLEFLTKIDFHPKPQNPKTPKPRKIS